MSLVDSNYVSLIHGVSRQDPKDRSEGQCTEQINMMSEPVEGLIRRPGVKSRAVIPLTVDPATSVFLDFTAFNKQFSLIAENTSGDVQCINETDGTNITVYREASAVTHLAAGPTTWAKIGDFLAIASDKVTVTAGSFTPTVVPKHYGNIEVRSGAFSAKYIIKFTGLADFVWTTPDGSASAHVAQAQPEFIANAIYNLLVANATLTSKFSFGWIGNTITIIPLAPANEAELRNFMADDGFGNLRMRYAHDVVKDTTLLPVWAPHGQGLTVGRGGKEPGDYYVYFTQDTSTPDLNPRSGKWLETTAFGENWIGANGTWPTLAYVFPNAGTFICIIGSPAEIEARYAALGFGTIDVPDWGKRERGDSESNPVPRFVGGTIAWMGVFQDRLTILSGNTVSMSRTKDYLQFFRKTVVTLLDDDPAFVSSTFGESSDLLAAVPFDRNLLITALGQQYILYGKVPITPRNISLLASSAFESSPVCAPLSHGNFAYFATANENNAELQEVYTDGAFDTAVARSVSSHVDTYIPGDITRLVGSTKAGMIVAQSAAGKAFIYRYLFNDTERLLSAWSQWIFGGQHMHCRSIRWDGTRMRLLFSGQGGTDLFVGEINLAKVGLLGLPGVVYPDHWFEVTLAAPPRASTTVVVTPSAEQLKVLAQAGTSPIIISDDQNMELPYTRVGDVFTIKDMPVDSTVARFGIDAPGVWKPTMPVARDADGKVVSTATLVVLDMVVTYTMGEAFTINVDTDFNQHYEYEVSPRLAGTVNFTLGERAVAGGKYKFAVMADQDAAEATITVSGTSPLVVTTLDWRGQLYKSGRRI